MFPVASPVFSCCSAGGGHKSSARSKRSDQRVRVVERVKMFQENPEENMRNIRKHVKCLCFMMFLSLCPKCLRKGSCAMVILTQYAPKDSENTPPMNHTQASLWIIQFCKSNGFKIHTRIQEQNAHFEFNRWEQRHGKKIAHCGVKKPKTFKLLSSSDPHLYTLFYASLA